MKIRTIYELSLDEVRRAVTAEDVTVLEAARRIVREARPELAGCELGVGVDETSRHRSLHTIQVSPDEPIIVEVVRKESESCSST